MPREPRVRRELPRVVFDTLAAARSHGQPYRYTERDVAAIAQFVSRLIEFDHDEVNVRHVQQLVDSLPTRREQERTQRAIDSRIHAQRHADEDTRREHAQRNVPRNALLARLSNAPPSHEPIVHRPVLIDFTCTSDDDRVKIFIPKLEATLCRLAAVIEVLDEDTIAQRVADVSALVEELTAQRAEERIGTLVEVLVEGTEDVEDEGECPRLVGRAGQQGPDVDGVTYLEDEDGGMPALAAGALVTARVVATEGVDLISIPVTADEERS